jgi:hypothetical protein
MDELEIDGKKYLSSRRAAKEHKYHTDYIGQLIRAGKIAGKKVGRAWYVEEASLDAYLKSEKEGSVAAPLTPMSAPIPQVVLATESVVEEVVEEITEDPIKEETVEEPAVLEPVEEKIIVEEKPEQKIHITLAERTIPQRKNTLTYIEDTEPLIPELSSRHRANADFTPIRRAAPRIEAEPLEEDEAIEEQPAAEKVKVRTPNKLFRTTTLAVIAVVTLAVFAGVSTMLATSIQITEGQPASVVWTIK